MGRDYMRVTRPIYVAMAGILLTQAASYTGLRALGYAGFALAAVGGAWLLALSAGPGTRASVALHTGCAAAILLGFYFLDKAPGGTRPATVIPFSAVLLGFLTLIAYHFFHGPSVRRGNMTKLLIAGGSVIAMIFGVAALVGSLSGALDGPRYGPGTVFGFLGVILGPLGLFYGLRYRTCESSVPIGEAMGMSPADCGPGSSDGHYDMKGRLGGLETLFNISEGRGSKHGPPMYYLEVLCRVSNPARARAAAWPGGFFSRPLSRLPPRLKDVPYWDRHSVHGEPAGPVTGALAGMRAGKDTILREQLGFRLLLLDEEGFKVSFMLEGVPDKAEVLRLVKGTAALAAAFDRVQ